MATKKAPRLRRWRDQWYVFLWDHSKNPPVQRRVSCAARGATTPEARAELLKQLAAEDKAVTLEVVRRGGEVGFDTPLLHALARYRAHVEQRREMRDAKPGSREGLAKASAYAIRLTLGRFEAWLTSSGLGRLTTGKVDTSTLESFIAHFARERGGPSKLNLHRRNLKTALRWLADLRPPLFMDAALFSRALRKSAESNPVPTAFQPNELVAFLEEALRREDSEYTVHITRRKPRGNPEAFEQAPASKPSTPISRLFLLCALTGARLGEVMALRWRDVDLVRGRVTIRAEKTGRVRILPLMNAPEGDVAPRFVELLRRWRQADPDRDFVLPHPGLAQPFFSKHAWAALAKATKTEIGPQALRQAWVSYAASMGVPAAVAALWAGHGTAVAERYYRAQVLDRLPGQSLEEAMGLAPLVKRLTADSTLDRGR